MLENDVLPKTCEFGIGHVSGLPFACFCAYLARFAERYASES